MLPIDSRRPRLVACLMVSAMCCVSFQPVVSADADKANADKANAETQASADEGSDGVIDPLSVNANCYVCHIPFVREEISKQHLAKKVTCVRCHGVSAGHVNDEDVGATKPDIVHRRDQIDAMCRKCHKKHDVPARDVLARLVERRLNSPLVVCTDCHGHHRIEPPQLEED